MGFAVDTNEVYVIDREKEVVHIPKAPKMIVARKILDILIAHLNRSS